MKQTFPYRDYGDTEEWKDAKDRLSSQSPPPRLEEFDFTREATHQIALREAILKALEGLTPRERDVLIYRYGLKDGIPRSLGEAGKRFNTTKARVLAIESKAIKRLRNCNMNKVIRDVTEA